MIANSGSAEIRVFDSEGDWMRTLGGEGDGPGEFRSVDWIGRVDGDTLLAFDTGRRRLTLFGPERDVARTVTLEGASGLPMGSVAPLPDGTYVVGWDTGDVWTRVEDGTVNAGETARSSAVLLHYSHDGTVLDTVGAFPGFEAALRDRRGQVRPSRPPFGRGFSYAAGGDHVFVGTHERFTIDAYAPDGRLVRSVRRPGLDLSVTSSRVDSLLELVLAAADNDRQRRYYHDLFRNGPLPEKRSAFGRMLVDPAGNLWVGEYSYRPLPSPRWYVFDPDGSFVAQVDVPSGLSVTEAGDDYVLGVRRGSLGVQRVELFRLVK